MGCVTMQLENCSKTLGFTNSMDPRLASRYFDIAGINTKFDRDRFEAACAMVCGKDVKPFTKKAIAAKFCG